MNDAVERACPACAETIKAAAKVCRHCGQNLAETPCRNCGGLLVASTHRVPSSGAMTAGWLIGIPGIVIAIFWSILLGVILLVVGIVLQYAVKEDQAVLKCRKCGALRPQR